MSRTLVILTLILVGTYGTAYTQNQTESAKRQPPAELQLENVHIQAQSIESFFANLSLSYNTPIGLEVASNDNAFAIYDIELKKGTLADFLNQFVKVHSQYTWDTTDGVINIFPKDNYRDLAIKELLKTEIAQFKIAENTSCFTLVDSLLSTTEVKSTLATSGITQSGLNFSGGYFPQLGHRFTLNVSKLTVRSILNKVVKESPLARTWVTKKYGDEPKFFIHLKAFHTDAALQVEDFKEIP